MSKLVIVESPGKVKNIKKYLGKGYEVMASNGHIRDLPKSRLGVDIENNFEPHYIQTSGKAELVKKLKAGAKKADKVFLATDPDREGEAISWHLAHLLKLDLNDINRISFTEITKTGVKQGMSNPRKIDIDLVDAQQARRVLDRIVGYKISPFLWKKIKAGLSAGRVQSVVVKLIVDRENEIKAFNPEEYWTIDAKCSKIDQKTLFLAKFHGDKNGKIEISNKEQADDLLKTIENSDFIVKEIKKSQKKKNPQPPFITSTLQQEASKRLGFQTKKTMKIAQELYEGVDAGVYGSIGLITYMRTDSLRISDEALEQGELYVSEKFGKEFLPEKRRTYKNKNKSQDAHEAIRPSTPSISPLEIKENLSQDQYKLYKLIWERFIASMMASAVYDAVSVKIDAGGYIFKSNGQTIKFKGFTAIYEDKEEEIATLPALKENEILDVKEVLPNQHFTQPPARYTEASLVKTLEENGIGRPSTYAPIIATVLARNYVEREQKALKPTVLGEITTGLIEENFNNIVDVDFTAKMESDLDKVEMGKVSWKTVLSGFYGDFEKTLVNAEKILDGTKIPLPIEETDVIC
ncbi:MAG: type I DNA topoisomerase, partial [Oscillospiraceae bacterium]